MAAWSTPTRSRHTPARWPTHARPLADDAPGTYEEYADVVGLTPTFGDTDSGYADLDAGTATLALFDRAELVDATGTGGEDVVMCVYATDSVDDTYARLQAAGVSGRRGTHRQA